MYSFVFGLGEHVFQSIPRDVLLRHVPFTDVMINPVENEIHCVFRSLESQSHRSGTIYFSRHRPQIEIDGERYTVGFSQHAIRRACERIVFDWTSYGGSGDVFCHFDLCDYYEPLTLHRGQPAFSSWDGCHPNFVWGTIAEEIAGANVSERGWYHRIGYFPAVFCDGFFKAKTLLFPGYRSTPEYGAIQDARVDRNERAQMLNLARSLSMKNIQESESGENLVKWFHDQGHPQVKKFARRLFRSHV